MILHINLPYSAECTDVNFYSLVICRVQSSNELAKYFLLAIMQQWNRVLLAAPALKLAFSDLSKGLFVTIVKSQVDARPGLSAHVKCTWSKISFKWSQRMTAIQIRISRKRCKMTQVTKDGGNKCRLIGGNCCRDFVRLYVVHIWTHFFRTKIMEA